MAGRPRANGAEHWSAQPPEEGYWGLATADPMEGSGCVLTLSETKNLVADALSAWDSNPMSYSDAIVV